MNSEMPLKLYVRPEVSETGIFPATNRKVGHCTVYLCGDAILPLIRELCRARIKMTIDASYDYERLGIDASRIAAKVAQILKEIDNG